jgi:catechol 2,3-dioxygenase-like lactoylglutathione lyase family enzyme
MMPLAKMTPLVRNVTAVAAGVVLALTGSHVDAQRGEPPAPPAGLVTGFGNFSPMVANLDRTIVFYCDALGLTLSAAESERPVPWDAEPWHRDLHGSQGSPMRFVTAHVPGTRLGVEMVEQGSIERHPVFLRVQDPGNASVILLVRDLDRIFAAARRAGAPVVTLGGAPIDVGDGDARGRAVVVRDPDSHLVEFLQLNQTPPTTAPADSNLIGARMLITVADMAQTLHLYRDLLGLQFRDTPFSHDSAVLSLFGLKGGAQLRTSTTIFAGSSTQLTFVEVKGVDRTPLHTHIEDPGSTRFQLIVQDLDQALGMFKSAGRFSTVSNTGKILGDGSWEKGPISRGNVRWETISDLNNLFIVAGDRAGGQRGAGRATR